MKTRNQSATCFDCPFFVYQWCVRFPESKQIQFPNTHVCGEHPGFFEHTETVTTTNPDTYLESKI